MAKRFKVNSLYRHFAIRKSSGKIVNGWELSEDIKYWGKIDLLDIFPDSKFSEFSIKTVKTGGNFDFYHNWDNWEK